MTTDTVLTDAQIFDCFDRQCAEIVINFDADELYPVGRAIEQAVLQSPEVAAMRKDAERYRWVRDPCSGAENAIYYSRGDYGMGLMSGSMLDDAIDAAMQEQTC